MDLFWDKLEDATSYIVYMNKELHKEMSEEETNSDEMNFTFENLDNGQMYRFQVSGVNAQGEGEKSDVVQMVPRPGELASIKSLENSEFGDAMAILKWEKVEDATHYRIYRLGPSDTEYNSATQGDIVGDAIAKTDTTTYTDTPLVNDKYYFYQVEPIMEIPDERPVLGGRKSFTGRHLSDLQKRPGISANTINTDDAACSILLEHQPTCSGRSYYVPKGYKVEVKDVSADSDAQSPTFVSAVSSMTSHTISNLDYGKSYKAIVTATKADGLSGVTQDEENLQGETPQLLCERIPLSKPDTPTFATSNGGRSLQVSWSPVPRATHYKITRHNADGSERMPAIPEQDVAALGGTSCCVYEAPELLEGILYRYSIQAVLKIGGVTVLKSLRSPQGRFRNGYTSEIQTISINESITSVFSGERFKFVLEFPAELPEAVELKYTIENTDSNPLTFGRIFIPLTGRIVVFQGEKSFNFFVRTRGFVQSQIEQATLTLQIQTANYMFSGFPEKTSSMKFLLSIVPTQIAEDPSQPEVSKPVILSNPSGKVFSNGRISFPIRFLLSRNHTGPDITIPFQLSGTLDRTAYTLSEENAVSISAGEKEVELELELSESKDYAKHLGKDDQN